MILFMGNIVKIGNRTVMRFSIMNIAKLLKSGTIMRVEAEQCSYNILKNWMTWMMPSSGPECSYKK